MLSRGGGRGLAGIVRDKEADKVEKDVGRECDALGEDGKKAEMGERASAWISSQLFHPLILWIVSGSTFDLPCTAAMALTTPCSLQTLPESRSYKDDTYMICHSTSRFTS